MEASIRSRATPLRRIASSAARTPRSSGEKLLNVPHLSPIGVRVHLGPGEDVVCTFTNVERSSITIVKETNPKAGAEFEFTGDLGGFSLDDGESESFGDLLPGD